jgi:parallel beta-helix repeat protein
MHDYTGNAPPIVSTFKPALLAMRRCHVARYYEVLSQMGLNQIEDCLVEFPSGDAIDFDAGKPGSFIRNCTIRHGDAVNVDGIDLGYAADLSPTDGVVVEGCVIYGFPFDKGVSIGEAATNIVVRNCVVYGVNVGIAVKDSSRATIYNNTVADADIALSLYQKGVTPGGGHGVAYNNIFWGLGTNILVDSLSTIAISHSDVDGAGYQGAGNLNSNPLFLNGGLHDYRLAANSPCLGSGTNGSNMGAAFPVGSVLVDTDEDGMPDRWEMIYGFDFNNAADAALDSDGDGLSNGAEWVSGTDPSDRASVLQLSAVGFNTGGNTLQFLAVAGRDYTIQFRTNAGTGAWTKLQDVPAAPTNTLTTVTDPNISGVSAKFYRLVIPE